MGRGSSEKTAATAVLRRPARSEKQPETYVGSLELETVKGLPVRLDLHREIDDGSSEGWIVDLVEAHGPDGPAGYLKISFIPMSEMKRLFPDALHYAARQGGSYRWLTDYLEDKAYPREALLELLQRTDRWGQERDHREAASDEELLQEWRDRRAEIAEDYEEQYRRFCEFHLDRPIVDYIRVYAGDGRDSLPYIGGTRQKDESVDTPGYRGQGVGRAMYEVGALWMARRGLKLHASGLQSEEAEDSWQRFEDEGLTVEFPDKERNRMRRYLDPEKLLEVRPELADVVKQLTDLRA